MKIKIKAAAALQNRITIPMGTDVFSPAIPTSGEARAPNAKGTNPSKEDALPALSPLGSIARDPVVVVMVPTEDMTIKSGISIEISGPFITVMANSIKLPKNEMSNPTPNILFMANFFARCPEICVVRTIPNPFMAKHRLNCWADKPYIS